MPTPTSPTADEVVATLSRLQTEHLISLEDAVVVARDDKGKVKLHQSNKLAAGGAAGGALWGGLIGLIFFAPLFGMAVGAATGRAGRRPADVGVDDNFMKDLAASSKSGGAALILLDPPAPTADKVLAGDRALRRRGHPDVARHRGRGAPPARPQMREASSAA